VLEVGPSSRGPKALEDVWVPANDGARVPLSSIASLTERSAPLSIEHIGQFPAATISFNLAPGPSLGDAVAAIERTGRELPSR
jgi:multidrug efflux pump